MSEPKLDLTALSDALGDDPGSKAVDGKSKQDAGQLEVHDSPATLSPSPSSPRQEAKDISNPPAAPASNAGSAPVTREHAPHPDPNVQSIKGMFPDMDVETIQAVLVADGGNFEQAINTLLQMSDPTYVPPPPFQRTSQQEQDEQLARSLAAQEQQQSQQQAQSFFPASRGGGGFRSFISGGAESPSSSPSYDPTQLNYQPRVKRSTSGLQQQQQQQSSLPTSQHYEQRTQASSGAGFAAGSSNIWPGPKEAKEWQNDINRFAETGFAKAASTFSALRQRGEKALNGLNQPQTQQQEQQQPYQSSQGAQSGLGASSWSSRRPATMSDTSSSAFSPTIGSARGFDQDPSPVGENELAKILARGREENKKPGIADRYKKLSSGSSNSRSQSLNTGSASGVGNEDADALGWDDAGRTGDGDEKKKSSPSSFEPIRISDNSKDSDSSKLKQLSASPRNAVSLMDASAGRGIAPRQGLANKTDADGDDDDDDDGNDLEYVSNPFEDED